MPQPRAPRSYLLVWNPNYASFAEETVEAVTSSTEPIPGDWSTVNRQIRAGDRVYLVRVAVEPRGIVAHGHALDRPHQEEDGRHYVPVIWDVLRPEAPVLDLAALRAGVPGYNWTPQASGATLRPEAVAFLSRAIDGART